jgi:glyoxylase-like metal-dependent hydrolase (beta-lactamase superfamily II)
MGAQNGPALLGAVGACVIAASLASAQGTPSPSAAESKAAADAYTKAYNPGTPPSGQFAPRKNTFEHVTGDLWRAGDGTWFVGILVTPAGIVLVDTMNPAFIKWLKPQLAERFPGKQVKYVIYSHTHWDHIDGSNAFADTATFIAQENALKNLDGRIPHMPGDMLDRNDNGKFDPVEFGQPMIDHPWICGAFPGSVTAKDRDGDGLASGKEFYSDVHQPDIVYSDRMTLKFGGKTIELIFPGKNHANDGTAVLFHDERVLFTVDFPQDVIVKDTMHSLPSACGPFDGHPLSDWIHSYRTLEELDFDILSGGHGWKTFTRQDITDGREYFEYLTREVSSAMSKGMSLDEMRKSITLSKYKDWANYERLRAWNVEAAYYNLKMYK